MGGLARTIIGCVKCGAVCCSVVQCGAVCCSVVQCAAVWCSVLQCGAVYCKVLEGLARTITAVWCSVVQGVGGIRNDRHGCVRCVVVCSVWCSVVQCVDGIGKNRHGVIRPPIAAPQPSSTPAREFLLEVCLNDFDALARCRAVTVRRIERRRERERRQDRACRPQLR